MGKLSRHDDYNGRLSYLALDDRHYSSYRDTYTNKYVDPMGTPGHRTYLGSPTGKSSFNYTH